MSSNATVDDKHAGEEFATEQHRYCLLLRNQTSEIEIRGLSVGTGLAHKFPIEELYISLTTNASWEPRQGTPKVREARGGVPLDSLKYHEDWPRSIPLHEALAQRRLVVVGDPGMGKTTFLRHVVHALSQLQLGEIPDAAPTGLQTVDSGFPIAIRLSELAQHLARSRDVPGKPAADDAAAWLPHYLAKFCRKHDVALDEQYFDRMLRAGECTVLLDGLDEAPSRESRVTISRLVEDATRCYSGCRFVVTSRPAAYTDEVVLAEFAHACIEPLSNKAVETFLYRWCNALYRDSQPAAGRHYDELVTALRDRPDIYRMARNPVMLTALAVVHWNERRLPEQRADLYGSIINWLARSREHRPGRTSADRTVYMLTELALAMQDHPQGRAVQVTKSWAAEVIKPLLGTTAQATPSTEQAQRFLAEEEVDSGIIVGRGDEVRYWHLTFQEFLAARAIASRLEQQQRKILLGSPKRLYDPEWREVILLLGGVLMHQGPPKVDYFVSVVLDDLGESSEMASLTQTAGLLGSVIGDLAPLDYRPSDARYTRLMDQVMQVFDAQRAKNVPIKDRIDAAEALGQAGDARIDPRRDDYWIEIPAGSFYMGAQNTDPDGRNYDKEAYGDEGPVHEVTLDAFRIARFPLTVGQYRLFVNSDGYRDEQWWKAGGFGKFVTPNQWDEQLLHLNRPVTDVSWFEAMAYCSWAGFRLPTEAEWERAARGQNARKYPWGIEPPHPSRLNYSHQIGHVTPVGIYPLGNTPEGICDLAGNVWEWCADRMRIYAKESQVNPRGNEPEQGRVFRGGSWHRDARQCRSAYRMRSEPAGRYVHQGFRVVAVPLGSRFGAS